MATDRELLASANTVAALTLKHHMDPRSTHAMRIGRPSFYGAMCPIKDIGVVTRQESVRRLRATYACGDECEVEEQP